MKSMLLLLIIINAIKLRFEKVKEVVALYNVKQHKIVNLDLSNFYSSALTNDDLVVPKYASSSELKSDIPITYVPARNTIFLSYALGFAEIICARDIFIGAHQTDYANYPDCRAEFIESFETMANFATKTGVEGKRITIHAPLIKMSKAQIVKAGINLGVDYSKTISCYDPSPQGLSCSKCHACLTRLKAFEENNIVDPIKYLSEDSC